MSFLSVNQEKKSKAGVFIDIDGVVLQGGKPFEWSKAAIQSLWNNKIPFVFVTNGTYCSETLLKTLREILDLPFTNDHVMVAPSPCTDLVEYHDKRVLVCCQEDSIDLISELGFSDFITVEQLVEVFPELDYVDHKRRKYLLQNPQNEEQLRRRETFKPIEAILLLGEPINWECSLQVLIDVLMTNGDLRNKFKFMPCPHLPLIACNKDLTFKGAAALPRFGHGSFLECLETLFQKITNNELVYEQLMGKPYLVTYEYAAKKIQNQAKLDEIVDKFYIIGDNPDVDIRGANTFKETFPQIRSRRPSQCFLQPLPVVDTYSTQHRPVEAILVCTGVYNPQNDLLYHLNHLFDQNIKLDSQQQNNDLSSSSSNNNDEVSSVTIQVSNNQDNSSNSKLNKIESSVNLADIEIRELKRAMSRKNSFISYFDNKLNIPDLTVDNLLDAVNYIIKNCNVNNS